MQLKGTIVGLAAFALAMSFVPSAAAGIPVPKGAAEDIGAEAVVTLGDVAQAAADDQTAIGTTLDIAVSRTAASIGNAILDPGDQVIYVPTSDAAAAAAVVLDTAVDVGTEGFGFASFSSQRMSEAGIDLGVGTQEALNAGIDAASAFGLQTQSAANNQLALFGATTQGASEDLGGVQAVVFQGALGTYNAHAAPAACVVAGIAANLAGAVSAQQSCDFMLRS